MVYREEKSGTTPMFETTSLKSFGIHGLPDQFFHLGHILIGHFDARAGGHLEVDGELPGVGAGEESQAQERVDCQAGQEHPAKTATVSPGRFSARRTQYS